MQTRRFMDAWLSRIANISSEGPVPWEQAEANAVMKNGEMPRGSCNFLNASYFPSL